MEHPEARNAAKLQEYFDNCEIPSPSVAVSLHIWNTMKDCPFLMELMPAMYPNVISMVN